MFLKDYDYISRDDAISTFNFFANYLPFGQVKDEWIKFNPVKGVSNGGLVHIKYHLASPGSYAFINKAFKTHTLNITIIEAKDLINGISDQYCKILILGDRLFKKISKKYKTVSPI